MPETRDVLLDLSRTSGTDLGAAVQELADLVVELVPSCLGLSVTLAGAGLTFTMVATDDRAAALDGVQYLDGGPCVETAVDGGERAMGDALDEERWQQYALAAAAAGVRSSLSLPVVRDGRAAGAVNLYAADPLAFEGREDALRALVGAATGTAAVVNGDLPFRSRTDAQRAPEALRERDLVETAAGYLAASQGVDVAEAHRRLAQAADRAQVDVTTLAATILHTGSGADAV